MAGYDDTVARSNRNDVLEEAARAVEQLGENAADAFNNREDKLQGSSLATGAAINFYNNAAATVRALKS